MSKIANMKKWEHPKDEFVHLKDEIENLRQSVRFGLQKKYMGLAESMFRYDFKDDPAIQDMLIMSRDTVPEKFLLKDGECVWFDYAGDIFALPVKYEGGNNMFGYMSAWSPLPVGYQDGMTGQYDPRIEEIRNLKLNAENSVIMRNDLFGGNDMDFIDSMISELVDNIMTLNQLQAVAKCPFIFHVTEDNLASARLFYAKMVTDEPVIFLNKYGEEVPPVLESTQCQIDPALLELFDRFECQILEYLGFPCVSISKRAQQTVSEIQCNDEKITLRRMEKLHQREQALERINKLFGKEYTVVSVIDEMKKEQEPRTIGQEVHDKEEAKQ